MKKIQSISEIHQILLDIASAFSEVCDRHNIPYFMIGGTMLGAIRHKGFIPWDDDMDFAIPRKYYQQTIDVLKEELPSPFRCCTYKDNPAVRFCFFKIEDSSTILFDRTLPLPKEQHLGLNIDVFPLDQIDVDDKRVSKVMNLRKLNRLLYVNNPENNLKQGIRKMLRCIIPISRLRILQKEEQFLKSCDSTEMLSNVFGRWGEREFIPVEWYGEDVRYSFEGRMFRGIKEFDLYLKKLYGDYMQLPPESQRVAHNVDASHRE
ncbi:MAG: LicD family protein [Prevotella sp.]|nr:LicD family protein [Prevotella sp.]